MKLKLVFINLFLLSFSIYIPLLGFSIIDFYIISKQQYITKKILQERTLKTDLKQKISAIKSGYIPLFYPNELLKNREINSFYPIGSLPNKETYLCNEGYGLIKYKTDRFGLRNKDAKWDGILKRNNIFLIGDSYTHGACVPRDSTIDAILEKKHNRNTINLGSGSNTPYEYQAIIKSLIKPIIKNNTQDNYVIIIFYDNDKSNINKKKEKLLISLKPIANKVNYFDIRPNKIYTEKINEIIKNNYLFSKNEMIKKIYNVNKSNISKSNFYKISTLQSLQNKLKILILRLISNSKNQLSPSEKAISLLSQTCKGFCKPIITYIPNSNYWSPNKGSQIYKNKLKKFAIEYKVKFLDGEEVIDKDNIYDYAPIGSHLSIDGYKKIADLIEKNL